MDPIGVPKSDLSPPRERVATRPGEGLACIGGEKQTQQVSETPKRAARPPDDSDAHSSYVDCFSLKLDNRWEAGIWFRAEIKLKSEIPAEQ